MQKQTDPDNTELWKAMPFLVFMLVVTACIAIEGCMQYWRN